MSLAALNHRIQQLGGASASPVVSLELFFEGNDHPSSIGCNLSPHPGVQTFHRVLKDIRARPNVADVLVQIIDDDNAWPFTDRVYVITQATDEEVHGWAAALEPDASSPDQYTGWFGATTPPPGAPEVMPGYRVTYLFWD